MDNTSNYKRLTVAVLEALPRIVDIWDNFPYAELEGDGEALDELRAAVKVATIELEYVNSKG
jgi:hypothetical protein